MTWSDDELTTGTEFDPVIREKLEEADLILLLLSPSYCQSDYCWNVELQRAMERHDAGQARAIPILLRPMKWDVLQINKYTIIPKNLIAVTSWPNIDEALAETTREIDRVIDDVENHKRLSTPAGMDAQSATTPSAPEVKERDGDGTVFHCSPILDGPVTVRHSGITELLPDIILQFRGDPGELRIADIWVYANTNITSRLEREHVSEAIMSLATGHGITNLQVLRHNIQAVRGGVNSLGFLHVPLHELRVLPQGGAQPPDLERSCKRGATGPKCGEA